MDLFINRLTESTTIKNTDYTVFDIADTTTGSFNTRKISYSSLAKQLSSDVSANVKTLIDGLQANLNTTNSNLANKLDKRGLTFNPNEKVTGTLFINASLCATGLSYFSNTVSVNNNFISNVKDPVLDYDAVNKRTLLSAINDINPANPNLFLSKSGDTMTAGDLTLFRDPTQPKHATTMQWVTGQINTVQNSINNSGKALSGYIPLSGGIMTGGFITAANENPPTNTKHLSNKKYVDDQITTRTANFVSTTNADTFYVKKAGDTMTGFLTLNAAPTANNHSTTKKYVDDAVAGTSSNLVNYLTIAAANTAFLKKSGDVMTGGDLELFKDPTQPKHATTMQWVTGQIATKTANFLSITTADTLYIKKAGDTMTGFLTLNAAPTANNHSTTKKYVDDEISLRTSSLGNTYVKKSGDTMTGSLYLSGAPVAVNEAATKGYVDASNVYSLAVTAVTANLSHANSVIGINNASPITFTVPNNNTTPFPVGTNIVLYQQGGGQITVIGSAGVAILAATNKVRTFAQNSCVALFKVATNSWLLGGDLV